MVPGGFPGEEFGWSVDIDGDRAIVGAPFAPRRGAAYVFERVNGSWRQEIELEPSTTLNFNLFGIAVAIDGDRAVVGSSGVREAAYVFERINGMWTEVATLTPSNPSPIGFGVSVELSGERIVVGADRASMRFGPNTGLAYVFELDNGVWSEVATLSGAGLRSGSRFGSEIALDGSRALVSADGISGEETVFVFEGVSGRWMRQAELTPMGSNGAQSPKWFGISIDLDGDRALVGAIDGVLNSGSVYVFEFQQGRWSQTDRLIPDDSIHNARFGISVSLDGARALVGARGATGRMEETGAAYVFEHGTQGWSQVQKLGAVDGFRVDAFGSAVALDGDACFISALEFNEGDGNAYAFELSSGVWRQTYQANDGLGAGGSDRLGAAVSVDGDRALVGAPGARTSSRAEVGAVLVYERSSGVWSEVGRIEGDDRSFRFGESVFLDGDTAYVGAPSRTQRGEAFGSVRVFERQGDGVWLEVSRVEAPTTLRLSGHAFGSSFSVDGTRMVVGSASRRFTSSGVHVFERSGMTWTEVADLSAAGLGRAFGAWVDLDGDRIVATDTNRPGGDVTQVFERSAMGAWVSVDELSHVHWGPLTLTGDNLVAGGALFVRGATGWVQEAILRRAKAVDVAEGRIVMAGLSSATASVEVFDYGTGPAQSVAVTGQPNPTTGSDFGEAVALAGNQILVGAPGSRRGAGMVYVFDLDESPVAEDDEARCAEDESVEIDVLANDVDPEAQPLEIVSTSMPANGAVMIVDGALLYTPNADFFGTETLMYSVEDPIGNSDEATVTVTVSPVDDPPRFVLPTPEDGAVISLVEGDEWGASLVAEDSDGVDRLVYELEGLIPLGADAERLEFSFSPAFDQAGTHILVARVTDSSGLSDERSFTLEVSFIDEDADGLPDTWESLNGLDPMAHDSDGDTIPDVLESGGAYTDAADTDGDGILDAADSDSDGDGIDDRTEAGDDDPSTAPIDTDGDGLPDFLDGDSDDDGVLDAVDVCHLVSDPMQQDADGDGLGDACSADDDGDGVEDVKDNCLTESNPGQEDVDMDGRGDACDGTSEEEGAESSGCGCSSSSGAPRDPTSLLIFSLGIFMLRRVRWVRSERASA